MNEKQMVRIEGALMGALAFLQSHPAPQGMGTGVATAGDEYSTVVSDLRIALHLCSTWKALSRSRTDEVTLDELPGQLHIPGVDPCIPIDDNSKNK